MKFAVAVPVLALLPGAAFGGLLNKRAKGACDVAVTPVVRARQTITKHDDRTKFMTTHITVTKTAPTYTVVVTDSTTSTVGTQAGFVPANSAISSVANSKRSLLHLPEKRDAEAEAEADPAACPKVDHVKPAANNNAPRAKTITVPHTHVKTYETTRTIHPTVTVHRAKATAFAACSSSNLLGYTFGSGPSSNSTGNGTDTSSHIGINSVVLVSGSVPMLSETDTAYDCCTKCQQSQGCVGSQWRAGVCNIHVRAASAGTCSASGSEYVFGTFYADPKAALNANAGLILSNGRCGATWKYGGSKSS